MVAAVEIARSITSPGNETDRLSLLAFKAQITGDPISILSSWNESSHFCQWSGVTCGRRHQRVIELDLRSCQLTGSLSHHIGNLSFLRMLDLTNNSFSDGIPRELGRLLRLKILSLGNNSFSGEIPVNISHCSNLQFLDLQKNNLTGELPAKLGSLSKLWLMVFDFNNLVGEIPPSFGNLSSLEKIYAVSNNLQGDIPNSLGGLPKLRYFSVGLNNLSGMIPPSIFNLSSLVCLAAPVNQLHGRLPPNLGLTLPNLELLIIHNNHFSGTIPVTLSNASNLFDIELSSNSFSGKVPTFASLSNLQWLTIDRNDLGNGGDDDLSFLSPLANNTILEGLVISDNNLGGVLPGVLSNFSAKFKMMGFGRNQIRGSIPIDIGNLFNMEALGLEENQLTGIIPSSIGKLQNLGALYVNGNRFSGNIPSSLGNCTSLLNVNLRRNYLDGSIPSSFGNCRNLENLILSQNNLSGPIPKEVMGILSLSTYLILSENQLTGSLPPEVGKLVNLEYLDFSKNRFSGVIPASLGNCLNLEILHLEGNFLQGPIPESLSSVRAIQVLNLSYNKLTGRVPKFLGDLKLLSNLDLSYNDLEGEVPVQGIFENASSMSILGNKKLCGGIPQLNLSRCTSNDSTKSKSSTKLVLIIVFPCGFLGIVLISCLLLCFLRKTKKKPASGSSWKISLRRVQYEELLHATSGFSSSNLIGAGSFGSVYKGILASDGLIVAVKVFNLLHRGAIKSFMAECEAFINIRHRNLVKVLTACSSIDFQGNDFRALVYEYMVNGSLEDWLHPVDLLEEVQEPIRNLNLIQRLNVAIDVASALDYLQHHCQIPVVHCDLKPSNVLLDGDMTARVGDFGLARFQPETNSHQLSSMQTSSIGVKGTIGYTAPEYGMGSEVSIYGDVYSYGVLLLEMFTGKRPTDNMFKDGLDLHTYAKMALPNLAVEVVDPILLREAEDRSTNVPHRMNNHIGIEKILEGLIAILRIGVSCSMELPRERMDISDAVAEMKRIRHILLRIRVPRQHEIVFAPEGH